MVCSHHLKKHSSFEVLFDVASSVTSCDCLLYPGETDSPESSLSLIFDQYSFLFFVFFFEILTEIKH